MKQILLLTTVACFVTVSCQKASTKEYTCECNHTTVTNVTTASEAKTGSSNQKNSTIFMEKTEADAKEKCEANNGTFKTVDDSAGVNLVITTTTHCNIK